LVCKKQLALGSSWHALSSCYAAAVDLPHSFCAAAAAAAAAAASPQEPKVLAGRDGMWATDKEFGRQVLAGMNPW
jgi:hypothetical protein